MTLTLTIQNSVRLTNGAPIELVLHRRGAVAGRASTCDWPLPDPSKHISGRHFEVTFDGRFYILADTSTNGTFANGASERMSSPHRIVQGDRFQVGPYLIRATLSGEAEASLRSAEAAGAPPTPRAWTGWDDGNAAGTEADTGGPTAADGWGAPPASDRPAQGGWDAAPPPPRDTGRWQPEMGPSLARPEAHREPASHGRDRSPGPAGNSGWAPTGALALPSVDSVWSSPTPPPDPASGWSSAAPDRPPAPSPDDVWGRIAEGNVVDWARGGFGQPIEPASDPLGLAPARATDSLPAARPVAPTATAPSADGARFFAAAGLTPDAVTDPAAALDRAGAVFHRLVAGLVVMVEARARAKAQLGAEATAFSPQGHNPLKFARTPDEALAMLIEPPQRGFMPADQAVEDAFLELQSHQMATLKAMQGALRATLDRFSPAAIRARADSAGVLERIVPAARDATLWQTYEREFGGVAQDSDEAFMDVFAREFRRAYNDQARRNG
ncbi:type VI secretion system-associated FHA domain protein TagH [Sphingomonas sp. ERG5]|uniref:type VI secretion system-associated FHA domain protein TagH n=1 Tax=Sphingomonas sp. ERG5 TaxID=1381597 RepID=UPI00054B3B9B|nr:type VI secretion system-associated FHA domain protein TagH [Sphingomonas sp. ERG5]